MKIKKKYFISISSLLLCISLILISCLNNPEQSYNPPDQKPYKSDTILILNMEFKETKLLKPIMDKVTSFYHLPVVLKTSQLPQYAYFKARNRYRADSILNYLERYNKNQYLFVAGLTSKDISATNGNINDWGVFGLGSLNNKGCITSSFRLTKNVTEEKLLERLQKVILHEIGHNHGLQHCTSAYPCFMKAAAGKVSTVDSEPMDICKECREKIGLKL